MGMQEPCEVCGVIEWAHGVKYEQERIVKIVESTRWVGETLEEDVANLKTLIEGEREAYEQVTPQQAQINEIFKQASRDIANMPSNLSFEERGRGIDAIMGNARADADAIREGKKVMSENKKQFYTYEQNNSGGFWKAPAISVVVEASSEDEADTIAKQSGVYFFDEHDDCPDCCGSRWYSARGPYQQIPEVNAFDLRWEEMSGIPAQLVVTKDE